MQKSSSLFLRVYLVPRVCRGTLKSVGELGLSGADEVEQAPCFVELYYVFAVRTHSEWQELSTLWLSGY